MTKRASLIVAVLAGVLAAGPLIAPSAIVSTVRAADPVPGIAPAPPGLPETAPDKETTTQPAPATAPATTRPSARKPTTVPATRPSTGPTSERPVQPPSTRPTAEVAPDAKPLLERVAAYYGKAETLKLEGSLAGTFDVAGRSKTYNVSFTAFADGRGRFSYQPREIGLVMGNDLRITVFDEKRNAYAWLPPLKGRVPAANVPEGVVDILLDENPAILLMLTTQPDQLLIARATKVKRAATDKPALLLEGEEDNRTVYLDEQTGQILSMHIDMTPGLTQAGTANVKQAMAVVKYDSSTPAGEIAQSVFEWTPPRGATEFHIKTDEPPTTAPARGPAGPGGNGGPSQPKSGERIGRPLKPTTQPAE